MTTIVWDGLTLATDSQANCGHHKAGKHVKKLWRNIGPFKAVALSGDVAAFPIVLDVFDSMEPGTPSMSLDVEGVVLDEDHVAWEFDGKHWTFTRMPKHSAHGSGWALATAAMKGGADAVSALKITCELDLYSGGRVQKFTVKKPADGKRSGS